MGRQPTLPAPPGPILSSCVCLKEGTLLHCLQRFVDLLTPVDLRKISKFPSAAIINLTPSLWSFVTVTLVTSLFSRLVPTFHVRVRLGHDDALCEYLNVVLMCFCGSLEQKSVLRGVVQQTHVCTGLTQLSRKVFWFLFTILDVNTYVTHALTNI